MPRSLGGRLAAAFVLLTLAVLIAVGGALFVVLRGLHADAAFGALGDVADSVSVQVRQSVARGDLRGTILELRDRLEVRGIAVMLVGADGRLRPLADGAPGATIPLGDAGQNAQVRGRVTIDDRRFLYVASVLRGPAASSPKALAFLTADRSGALALLDLGRTVPAAGLAMLLVAAPLAWLVSRSVTGPLRRVAGAAAEVPAGRPRQLPLEGPSEVRELTGTFNAMSAELDATRRREAELLANLRHDLRTPLTVISGYATALRDGTATGEDAAAAARAIEEEAARLEELVAAIGMVEGLRSGTTGLRPERLDAREVAAAAVARFAARAAAAGTSLGVAPPVSAEPIEVLADRVAIERMLGNLVENALAVAPGGAVTIEVSPDRLASGDRGVRVEVLDNGPGFAPGTSERAFERFWRGDPARAGGGSGLGLAIVRELAAAQGGSAHAANRIPRGARVGFVVPAATSG